MQYYNLVEIAGFLTTIGTVVWKISQSQAETYKYIDNRVNDIYEYMDAKLGVIRQEVTSFSQAFAVHLASYEEKEDSIEYKINNLKEAIEHKSTRLNTEIQNIKVLVNQKSRD